MLENEADFAFADVFGGNVLSVKQDFAAVGVFQSGDNPQQRGFAAARRAEQRSELAGRRGQVDVFQGVERAEVLVQIFDGDAHAASLSAARCFFCWILVRMSCIASVAMASRARMLDRANAPTKLYSL